MRAPIRHPDEASNESPSVILKEAINASANSVILTT